jgi:hypothetical protein
MIDIKEVKAAARKEFNDERVEKAKKALIAQLRIVDLAEQNLAAARLKLADLEQQIADGIL